MEELEEQVAEVGELEDQVVLEALVAARVVQEVGLELPDSHLCLSRFW